MCVQFQSVFLTSAGTFLPGPPVGNEAMDQFIAPLDASSARIKRRILAENGIQTRHYAIDTNGSTVFPAATMAAFAAADCLAGSDVELSQIDVLCTGTSGGDLGMPGFASMVQGELAAPPVHASSHQGVCASGVAALQHAASTIELGGGKNALVVTSELPSRMFKRSRFAPRGYKSDFDAHFLRWMLSDGAGAWLLGKEPAATGISLQLKWVHSRSFGGDLPVCMQIGRSADNPGDSYLDYPSLADAEADGAFLLRQDIRLLPHLFELGIHEYAHLVQSGHIEPKSIEHFLCHYSSQKFAGVVEDLMQKAGLAIPTDRWYSNLTWRGNTGAASIFIMLADFMRERTLRPGERILCFVPESGRFTVAFMMFEVVAARSVTTLLPGRSEPPHLAHSAPEPLRPLLTELSSIWHDYRSRAWRTNLLNRIRSADFSRADYVRWMSSWIPQVRQGTQWMRAAAARLDPKFAALTELMRTHATDEQFDYQVLFEDYRRAGGIESDIDSLRRNPGGEALNAYLHRLANDSNALGLLGAIYVIEGTGQRIVPALLPLLRKLDDIPQSALQFLTYHGENDTSHLQRWLQAVEIALTIDPACARSIIEVARTTADLYLLQMEHAL